MNNSYNVENGKSADVPPSWWKKRSKMEKQLSVFSISALLLIVILIIVIIIYFTRGPTTCLSASCVQTTSELLDHMDLDANPCEDFYQFACGTFVENVQLEDYSLKNVETFMEKDVRNKIQGIIEEPIDYHDSRSMIAAKKLYNACMNETAKDERGLTLIKNSLRQIGGWPVLEGDNWQERNFEWKEAMYRLRHSGYDFYSFINFYVTEDKLDPDKHIIRIGPPVNPLYKASEEEEEHIYNYMVNLSIAFGAEKARARNEARDVIDFEKSLFYNPHDEEDNNNNNKYDPLTFSELQYKFHDIPWLEYFNTLQAMTPNITHDQLVTVSNPAYFIRLQNALRRITKRVVANYICWRTASKYSTMLTSEIEELSWNYYKEAWDRNPVPRPERCSELVSDMFTLPIYSIYVRRYLSKNAKTQVTEMLQNIKDEFREVLHDLDWMDEETRTKAYEKLSTTKQIVAYPEELLDDDKIEEPYIGVQVEEDNFLSSFLNVNFYRTNYEFRMLHEPVGKYEELEQVIDITHAMSSYSVTDNIIRVSAGLLQGIIYDEDRPQYLNYGALGSTLGHQVFHTVFEGKSCRQESKYYDWLNSRTHLAYNDKLSCVEKHYGKYALTEIGEHLNSSRTRNEDAADIAGVKLAYDAYNSWAKRNGPEKKLPGLNYTPQQLFWISSAVRFCGKATKEALQESLTYNYRSPGKYRALGSLRNSEEFISDFGCPRSSYMNAEDKCKII